MQTALICLIIMQINLVPDCVTPGTVLFWFPTLFDSPSWKGTIFQYGGQTQFLNFYNFVNKALFLNYNLSLKSAIFKFIIARFDPHFM